YGSTCGKKNSTPVGGNTGNPERAESQRQSTSESHAMRVYTSSAPYAVRVMRDSPPDDARACAGPQASSSSTRSPLRKRFHAVHAPNTPAPTTMLDQLAPPPDLVRDSAAARIECAPEGAPLPTATTACEMPAALRAMLAAPKAAAPAPRAMR